MHFERWRSTGTLKARAYGQTCSVMRCSKAHYGRGSCKAHHDRWVRKGDPGARAIRENNPGSCRIENCLKRSKGRGLCSTHYNRWLRTGTTDDPRAPMTSLIKQAELALAPAAR
jgi:hypothetical protein